MLLFKSTIYLKIFCLHILYWKSGINISYYYCLSPFNSVDVCFIYFSSVTQSCPTLCDPMNHSTPGLPVHHQLLEFTQAHVHWVSDAIQPLILHRPFLLLPSIFPSIRVFFNESALCIRRPKYWSFNFSVNPANEYSGLTYFRIDWFDLLAVQGTLKPQMPSMCY